MNHIKALLDTYLTSAQQDWQLKLLQQWSAIVGDLSVRIRLEKIQEHAVIIGVYDAHWMHELFHMSRLLIDQMNSVLGGKFVHAVRFVLVKKRIVQDRNKQKNNENTRLSPHAVSVLSDEERRVLEKIKDYELRRTLESVLVHIKSR